MNNYQHIYNRLRGYGLSEAGAIGVLGNLEAESNCEPNRVQGDYYDNRALSRLYTEKIDRNETNRIAFSLDQKGYGLAQWTFPQRKLCLFDKAKEKGVSIGDLDFQIDFLVYELQYDFPDLNEFLTNSNNIHKCTDRVCREYENPAIKNVEARYQLGLNIRQNIDLTGKADITPSEDEHAWTPSTLSMSNAYKTDCVVLQSILNARHFPCGSVDGFFGAKTQAAVTTAQRYYGQNATGICGPELWAKLRWGD